MNGPSEPRAKLTAAPGEPTADVRSSSGGPSRIVRAPGPSDERAGGSRRKLLVVYASRFGNTRRIAEALARGLGRSGEVDVECLEAREADAEAVAACDFLAVGGPTEMFTASAPMKEFLARLSTVRTGSKSGFAFETRLHSRLSGSAGKYIEKHLAQLGYAIVRPYASAIVRGMSKAERAEFGDVGAPEWVQRIDRSSREAAARPSPQLGLLVPGAETEFEQLGAELGARLAPLVA